MKNIFFLGILLMSLSAAAQMGKVFPVMETESLNNTIRTLPESTKGKFTVVGLAFTKKSEDALKTWFQPMFTQFLEKSEEPSLFSFNYDVNVLFVPMFTGAKRPAYEKAMESVKESLDRDMHDYVVFYKGSLKEYKEALNFDGKNVPYFYLLDAEGKIVYITSGPFSNNKMQRIVDIIDAG